MEQFLLRKISLCCVFLLLLVACPAQGQFDHGFSYNESSSTGPSNWGEINPEWHMCSDGKMQSPVDIWDYMVQVSPQLGRLQRHYKPSAATLVNRGFDVRLQWIDGGGYIRIDGTEFQLVQCHWHAPSEHLRNGRSYDLEIHLVHQSKDGRIAVIGMLYKIGLPDPFLSQLEHLIEDLVDTTEEINVGYFHPEWINIGYGEYYRYMGSLTTPPCSENIIWTVMRKVNTVSRRQVELIRRAIHDDTKTNARPVQPLNNRRIQLYTITDDIVEEVLGYLDKSV